ncbi:MAG: OmpA family protein, partial [Pseudomonadota bacterium]
MPDAGLSRDDRALGVPRRLVLAAIAAAVAAGGAVTLAQLGGVSAPATQSFRFARGTTLANGEEARLRAALSVAARDDRITVTITGHSGTEGDAAANQDLSAARAALAAAIAAEVGIDADRIRAAGVGGGDPLPRETGQSDRAYQAALSRVELSLQV